MTENIYSALFKFQGLVRGVKRDSKNPHFRNNYASLEAVTDTIRPHMQECGLMWLQSPGKIIDGSIEVKTTIAYPPTKETIEFTMEMPLAKRDPQGAGSAMTYAMRYSLMAALGLPPTDDDAETAIDRDNSRPEPDQQSKSSAQLKRDGEWERVTAAIAQDMIDVHTFAAFESLKRSYRDEAKKNGWNRTFLEQLADHFAGLEDRLAREVEKDNLLMAGE